MRQPRTRHQLVKGSSIDVGHDTLGGDCHDMEALRVVHSGGTLNKPDDRVSTGFRQEGHHVVDLGTLLELK